MARPRKNKEATAPWVVRDVPEFTRNLVRGFAGLNNMTMAQAIQLLIARGVEVGLTTTHNSAIAVLRDLPDPLLAELMKRASAEIERRNSLTPEERTLEEMERLRTINLASADPNVHDSDVHKLMAEYLRAGDDERTPS